MNDVMRELDSVFKMISQIPVSGDNVDLMYASRDRLRHIYAVIKKMSEEQTCDTESTGD